MLGYVLILILVAIVTFVAGYLRGSQVPIADLVEEEAPTVVAESVPESAASTTFASSDGRYLVLRAGNSSVRGDAATASHCIETSREAGISGKVYLDGKLIKEF